MEYPPKYMKLLNELSSNPQLLDITKTLLDCIIENKTPYTLSDDLYKFLEVNNGSKLSRLDVTKKLCEYIELYNLQDENNKRIIVLDENLANLFNLPVGKQVTCYEIQQSLQNHFK